MCFVEFPLRNAPYRQFEPIASLRQDFEPDASFQSGIASIGRGLTMPTNPTSPRNEATTVAHQTQAASGLAIVWVFFENLGKGLYRPAGYAGLIDYYIKNSHSPAIWKSVMALAASHAAMAAPMQAVTEISLGILLVVGLLTRPAA